IKYISNVNLDEVENCLSKFNLSLGLGVFLNIQFFQLFCFWSILINRKIADVVIVRQSVGFVILNLLLKLFGFKVITEVNGLLYQDVLDRRKGWLAQQLVTTLERWNLELSDAIVSVHDNVKQTLTSYYGNKIGDKTYVVENGVDLESPSTPQANEPLIIGYLGSFAHREGVDYLPQVSSRLDEKGVKHEFLMIGGSDGEIEELKSRINSSQRANFKFLGYIDYKKAKVCLKSCHAFIHLRRPIKGITDSQGCPLKTLDYLSVGRCVVATKIESYKFIEDHQLGIVVPYTDDFEADVASAIARQFQHGFDAYYNKGQAYLENKTWKHQIGLFDDICNKVKDGA
ncbi:glycosyltransferase, partial [Salinivibrio sp. AR640]|uniref:glycosyltransferase n=1 Tax=Salinivibrio sp. AR640 TaxID=1909437 RepID=UPI0009CFC076